MSTLQKIYKKTFLETLREMINKIRELTGKKNYGFFISAIFILGVWLKLDGIPGASIVAIIGSVGLIIYNLKRQDTPQWLLFFALTLLLLFKGF